MMRVRKTTVLPAPKKAVFARLVRLKTLQYIAYPYATFTPINGNNEMIWEKGAVNRFAFRLFGSIPFGTHTIKVLRFDIDEGIYTRESNAHVPVWNHRIILKQLPDGRCLYTDIVDIEAGLKTFFVYLWANCFYAHRQKKWVALLKRSYRSKNNIACK